jgi:glycerol-3-phosphate responsive antiterminator
MISLSNENEDLNFLGRPHPTQGISIRASCLSQALHVSRMKIRKIFILFSMVMRRQIQRKKWDPMPQ